MSSRGHKKTDSQASYYFVSQLAGTNAVRDRGDDGDVIENMPPGVEAGAFSPRRVNKPPTRHPSYQREAPPAVTSQRTATSEGHSHGIFEFLSGKKHQNLGNQKVTDSGTKKVDPKVYFSTERTFLAWMHAAVLLAGISIAITAYSDTGSASAIYGLMLLPIAIVAIVYSMLQFSKRTIMIDRRSPGPYEDTWGPVLLGGIFVTSIIVQFFVKLYELANQ